VQTSSTQTSTGGVAMSAAVAIAALLAVGVIEGELPRLAIQCAPLWMLVIFGWRGGGYVRWAAVPLFAFWILMAAVCWADRLGATHLAIHVSSDEAMALAAVAVASAVGLLLCLGQHERVSPLNGLTLALACGALQIGAFYLGMQPLWGA
jgi:hypothetical protein